MKYIVLAICLIGLVVSFPKGGGDKGNDGVPMGGLVKLCMSLAEAVGKEGGEKRDFDAELEDICAYLLENRPMEKNDDGDKKEDFARMLLTMREGGSNGDGMRKNPNEKEPPRPRPTQEPEKRQQSEDDILIALERVYKDGDGDIAKHSKGRNDYKKDGEKNEVAGKYDDGVDGDDFVVDDDDKVKKELCGGEDADLVENLACVCIELERLRENVEGKTRAITTDDDLRVAVQSVCEAVEAELEARAVIK